MSHPVQSIIDSITKGSLPAWQLRSYLENGGALVRINALLALMPFAKADPAFIKDFQRALEDPKNAFRLMGTVTIAHLVVGCLFQVRTPEAVQIAQRYLEELPEPDRSDLLWYLQSEKILVDSDILLVNSNRTTATAEPIHTHAPEMQPH